IKMVGARPSTGKMIGSMVLMLIGLLRMAYVLNQSLIFGSSYLHISGWMSGVGGAFWYWFGFAAPITMGQVLWENKPWKLWFIDAGYYLVGICAMGAILAGWR